MEWKEGDRVRVKSIDRINWNVLVSLNSEVIKKLEGEEGIINKIDTTYTVKLGNSQTPQILSKEAMNAVFEKVNFLPEDLFKIE